MATIPARRLPAEHRRAQLLDCALELLGESGFGAVNIEAVARRAGVSRPVVYDTFGSLEALLLALIDRAEEATEGTLLEILDPDPGAGVDPERFLVDSTLAFLRAVHADPANWRLVLMPPRGNSPELARRIRRGRRRIAERVHALLDWGIAARGGPSGLDHALLAHLIVAAGEDAARLTLAHPKRFSAERLAAVAGDIVTLLPAAESEIALPAEVATPVAPATPATPVAPATPATPQPPPAAGVPTPAPPGRRRMPQAERREQLLDVALELLSEEGFAALSMESIARRAEVNRVVIYRSFANLPVLLAALMHREDRRVRATLRALVPPDLPDPHGSFPRSAPGSAPGEVLVDVLGRFLRAVSAQPETWRVALLRPESAPRALQKIVDRRRTALARRLEPLVQDLVYDGRQDGRSREIEAIARMLLTMGEEQGRLALDDPEFPPERLLGGTRGLIGVVLAS